MKSTESLDIAEKSVDLGSVSGETGVSGDTSLAENKRRRLVRGAVAFAPLVLTLRSGALAAASCTGARLVRINNNNRIGPNSGVVATDICFPDAAICEGYPTAPGDTKVQSVPAPTGIALTPHNNGSFSCGNANLVGRNVAILSSTSAGSLLP